MFVPRLDSFVKRFVTSRAVMFVVRLLVLIKRAEWKNWTVPKMFSETAKATPDKVMFYFEDQVWTFKQVKTRSASNIYQEFSFNVKSFFSELILKRKLDVRVRGYFSVNWQLPTFPLYKMRGWPTGNTYNQLEPNLFVCSIEGEQLTNISLKVGCGGGLVVSTLDFYSDDTSSIHAGS